MTGDISWLTARPIAHRGLHAATVPENSLGAARAAIARGFAIECDVLLSRDGVPMVFHDHGLERLTGETGALADRPALELAALTLKGTAERVPTLAAFLESVAGATPIVMELKGTSPEADDAFMKCLSPVIQKYGGQFALMSFDAWLIDQALADDGRAVGLTAEGTDRDELDRHRNVFDRGCRFVSYNVAHLPNGFVRYAREEKGAPVITWTVRTPADAEATRAYADQMTFEGFLPQN